MHSMIEEKEINLHLISDSTGDTVFSAAKACLVQFPYLKAHEHLWPLIRHKDQMDEVLSAIEKAPGPVIYTMVNRSLRRYLQQKCNKIGCPHVHILSPIFSMFTNYLGITAGQTPGLQYNMDQHYFDRVEAMQFTIQHDDGQSYWSLDDADIVLLGVSRTSKTPTSMYLANRGYRVANIPLVPGTILPENIYDLKNTLVVGLNISTARLKQLRMVRVGHLDGNYESDYVDIKTIRDEANFAKKLFTENKWPMIDISQKSIEETSLEIIKLYREFKDKK